MCEANTKINPIVDLYGDLWLELKDKIEMLESLKKQLSDEARNNPTTSPLSFVGERWRVDFSAPSTECKLVTDPQSLLSIHPIWEAVTISTTKAKALLPPQAFEQHFYPVPGSRRIKQPVPLAVPGLCAKPYTGQSAA